MKTCIKNVFLLPALIAGLGLILTGRVVAQTYPDIAGNYSIAATAAITATVLGQTGSVTNSASGSGYISQSGNTFSETLTDPFSGLPVTQSGVLSGNNIISMSGPIAAFQNISGLVVNYNKITSGSGVVLQNQIDITMTGIAGITLTGTAAQNVGVPSGTTAQYNITGTAILTGNVNPLGVNVTLLRLAPSIADEKASDSIDDPIKPVTL